MASAQASTGSTVPQLLTRIQQLTPAQLREFKRRFAQWQQENGEQPEEETALAEMCKARLSAADERRLKKLIAKSEGGALSPQELEDYRTLVQRAERLDATRLAALTELARRWGKPVRTVMEIIGWQESEDETTGGHPPRPPEAGARSRR